MDLFLKQIEGKGQSSSNLAGQVQGNDDTSDHQQGDEESSQSSGNSAGQVQGGEASGRHQGEEKAVKAAVTQ